MRNAILLSCIVLAVFVAGCAASEEAPPVGPAAAAPRPAASEAAPAAAPADNLESCLSDCESIYQKENQKGVLLSCKAICHTDVAKETRDAAACEPIKGLTGPDPEREYRKCIVELAIVARDASLCDRFAGKEKDLCRLPVALRLNDPALCPAITDQVMRMTCEGETGR